MAFEVMRFATAPQYLPDVIQRGSTFPPEEALQRGLVDHVVGPDELMDRALAEANALGALPPATFALTKTQIRQPLARPDGKGRRPRRCARRADMDVTRRACACPGLRREDVEEKLARDPEKWEPIFG
jgi:enoyl-CoA hydratase